MDTWHEENWFAVQARPHQEDLGAANIAKLDLEVFLPRVRQTQRICGVPRSITRPLFCGYFFSRFVPIISIDAVRYSHGVLRVVGTNRFPVPVAPEIIAGIQERLQPDGLIHLEAKHFHPGDVVRVDQGPFEGFMGRVEREYDGSRRVAILLEALQQARLVVEKDWIRPTEPA
jgi:transcription antitermination factor NusG